MPWMAILDIYMPFGRHKYTFSRVFYIHVAWIRPTLASLISYRNEVDFICVDTYAPRGRGRKMPKLFHEHCLVY